MRTNDADGFCRLLDPDWAIVTGIGALGDSVGVRDSVCAAIKAGTFTRKTYEPDLANARVRVYGNSATVTFNPRSRVRSIIRFSRATRSRQTFLSGKTAAGSAS
jgi:hypothetical protein